MAEYKPQGIKVSSIVGRAGAPAEDKFDGKLTELRVAVTHRKKDRDTGEWEDAGTTWLTYQASGDYAAPLKAVGKGDLIEITDAALETREFTRKDGTTGLGVSARFGTLNILEAKDATKSADPWA